MKYCHRIVLGLGVLTLLGCQAHDEAYYATHPKVLQTELRVCERQGFTSSLCTTLRTLALHMNRDAKDLTQDPLAYGHRILDLQAQKASYEQALLKHPTPLLKEKLRFIERDIEERLWVVRWLESPRNRT